MESCCVFKKLKMKRIYFTFLICFVFVQFTNAQDFTFSQFYEMPLMRNPALTGIFTGDIRFQAGYRSQWESVPVPYKTQVLSGEARFPIGKQNDFISVGLQLAHDEAGDSKLGRIELLPVVNFHKSFNDKASYLSFALMGGVVQSQFDPTRLTFDDQFVNGQYDPLNPTNQMFQKTSITHMDGGTGLAFSSTTYSGVNYYLGVGAYHLLKPKVTFFDDQNTLLMQRYVANAGVNVPTGDNNNTYFYADYNAQGGNEQFLAGVIYCYNIFLDDLDDPYNKTAINFGLAYRWADAVIPITKLEINKFIFGASYDVNVSKLSASTNYKGGFEFSMSYKSTLNINIMKDYGAKCPKF